MAEAVVVGVRVRPFNDREIGLKATLCLDMQGPSTVITGPSGIPQTFSFDQSFWSHDDFVMLENGYCAPKPGGRYADQRLVFDTFGQRVLDNAWAGYHCCLFAYGQTGAGKSYSMVGYGENKGIVPISCEEIFKRVNANSDKNKSYEIQISMVEIYNETVQDLFIPFDQRPKNGFQIRESKALGIYVDGIVKNAVDSYSAIERAIDQGTANRSIGSTQMNATSSRAHTVITIEFKQVDNIGGMQNVKVSNINLIDLAGSEKANQTGATGDRLKEGSAINKSLSALGNVIEKLAEKSQGKAKKDAIPYRDSKLTRLLQNALGGSSKTIMICALSPASSNYEETLSTLRYADRAKKIKNSAVINENPQEKLMRELREENAKLKGMLGDGGGEAGGGEVTSEMKRKQEEKIAQLQQAMTELQKSFQEKIQEAKKRHEEHETRQTLRAGNVGMGKPMIVNLNAEMQLTGKLRYEFSEGKTTTIGGTLGTVTGGSDSDSDSDDDSSNSDEDSSDSDSSDDSDSDRPTIELSSPGVLSKHARIENVGRRCILTCFPNAGAATWINGTCFNDLLEQKKQAKESGAGHGFGDHYDEDDDDDEDFDLPEDAVQLRHCDRLVMGRAIFLFVDPAQGIIEMLIMSGLVSYAKARKELPPGWKRTVTEGTKDAKQFQVHIQRQMGGDKDENSERPRQSRAWQSLGNLAAPRGSGISLKSSLSGQGVEEGGGGDDDDDDDGESSLGEGATKDEVMILQLKDDIAARDRAIEELKRERDHALDELKQSSQDVARLRQQLEEVTAASGQRGPVASTRGKHTTPRAGFNEKVNALNGLFEEALAALDNTRLGLTSAVAAFDSAAAQDGRSMSMLSVMAGGPSKAYK